LPPTTSGLETERAYSGFGLHTFVTRLLKHLPLTYSPGPTRANDEGTSVQL